MLKSAAPPATVPPEDIGVFNNTHFAAFKVARFLEYHDELPVTPSSKVEKNILRDESRWSGTHVFDLIVVNRRDNNPTSNG